MARVSYKLGVSTSEDLYIYLRGQQSLPLLWIGSLGTGT